MSIGTDGRQIVRYSNVDELTLETRALFRLKVTLDANLDGNAEQTASSPAFMFSRETFPVGRRTFSMPLVNVEHFAGTIITTSAGITLPKPVTMPTSAALFIEDLATGKTYEVNKTASNQTQIVTVGSLDPAVNRIALRTHQTLSSLLPAEYFSLDDTVLSFDAATNSFTSHDLTPTGWAEDSILPKQTGVLIHVRSSEVSIILTGQVTGRFEVHPTSNTRFLGSGSIQSESPLSLGLTPEKHFRTSIDPVNASRLRLWKSDFDSTESGYDQLYLSPIMWLRENDPNAQNLNEERLIDPFRAFFLLH
jgi:hypothetical protein